MTERDDSTDNEADAAPSAAVQWTAGLAIAAALIVGIVLYYRTRVCDEQLTRAGKAVCVNRNLRATDPPILAVGLIVLVALSAFFSEISGFGVTLKRQVRRANKRADAAISKATDAENAAQSARQTSRIAEEVTLIAASERREQGLAGAPAIQSNIDGLASQYNQIRRQEQAGADRTSRMTTVVSKMISALSGVPADDIDLETYIADKSNDGRRLAAYAYMYANPDPRWAPGLAGAILAEPTPFGQYWAIRAIRRSIALDPSALDLNSRRQLEDLLSRLGPNTDRAYELRQALSEAQKKERQS